MKIRMPPSSKYLFPMANALLFACTLFSHNARAYEFGEGYTLGNVHLSGYTSIAATAPQHGHDSLSLDELSLFASGKFNRYLNPFMEAEVSDAIVWKSGRGMRTDKAYLSLERLYNDIELSDNDTVRLGQMLTPVGEWNIVHAEPLVWTTTRPVTTYYSFPEYASGLAYLHQPPSIKGLGWEIYAQPSKELVRKPRESATPRDYRNVVGASLYYDLDINQKLGIASQYGEVTETGEKQWLLSVDGQLQWKQLQLEFQATDTHISGGKPSLRAHDNEWGGYLQLADNLYGHWNLIGRAEYFQAREYQEPNKNALIGIVYRPTPAVSYKLEYLSIHGTKLGLDSGLYSSIAILF